MRSPDANATFAEPADESVGPAPAAARFRVDEELARGGLGRVLRGFDTHLEREVAIKTMLRASPAARLRFERETRLTARLQHPNIVPVYDGGVDDEGLPFLAMRLVRGRTLAAEIERRATLEDRLRLLPAVIAACNAVAYAHHQRVAHRDLKPDNLLVGDFGETLVIDWGLAKDLDGGDDAADPDGAASGSSGSLTRVGAVVGTPAYMPPEQAAGRPAGVQADVYALGAVLYHVLAGRPPFAGAPDVLAAVLAAPPAPVDGLAPGAPRDLVAVVEKAMARDPGGRYADAQALARDLERFQAGRFVDAHHYTLWERAVRLVRRNPWTSALAAVALVGGAAAIAGLAGARQVAEARRTEAERARADAESLQRAERERLVASTREQARLLAATEPAQSLALLARLPPDVPFDGAVRSIAAQVLADPLPRPLPGPVEGEPHQAHWVDGVPVVSWGTELRAYPPEGVRVLATDPDGEMFGAVPGLGGVAYCRGSEVRVAMSDGAARSLPLGAPCVAIVPLPDGGVVATDSVGGGVEWSRDGSRREVDTGVRPVAMASGPDGSWHVVSTVGAFSGSGGPHGRSVQGASYGVSASPFGPEAVLLGVDPPLVRVTWSAGPARVTPGPAIEGWLQYAAWIGPGVVAVGGGDASIHLWDTSAPAPARLALPAPPRALAALPGGDLLVSVQDGSLLRVDPRTGDRRALSAATIAYSGLEVSPDGTAVLVTSPTAVAVLPLTGEEGRPVVRRAGRVRGLATSAAGRLVVAAEDGVVAVEPSGEVQVWSDRPASCVVDCGGWWIGRRDGAVERAGGSVAATLPSSVEVLRCAPDGAVLTAASRDGSVVLDAASGRILREVPGAALAMSPDGAVWVAEDDAVLRYPTPASAPVRVPPAGRMNLLVVGAGRVWSGAVTGPVWEVAPTPRRIGRATGMVTAMVSVGDGLLVGDEEGGVRWWRSPDAAPELLSGHRLYVGAAEARPGGRFVATGGWDNAVWLWDLSPSPPSGRPLRGHDDAVTAMAWSADGATLYTGDRSGVVRAWTDPLPLEPAALRAEVERRAALIVPR